MAGDAGAVLQEAVYTLLAADAGISALSASVYDFVPKTADLPYILVGDDSSEWNGTMGIDWGDIDVTIHSYTYGEGRKTVKQLMAAVYTALHKTPLTISGFTHVSTLWQFSDTILEDDGVYHGVQRFRVVIHEPF